MNPEKLATMNTTLEDNMFDIHQILKEYIVVHNNLYKMPRGVFSKISKVICPWDFSKHVEELQRLITNLECTKDSIWKNADDEYTSQELALSLIAVQFIDSLHETIKLLQNICQRLQQKSEGDITYTYKTYRQDYKLYKVLVNHYSNKGTDLNNSFRNFQD